MPRTTPTKPKTVLIVEHEALVLLELAAQLADMGLIVLTARDADEAIALLDARPEIRLLLTDIRMPGSMDGIRLAHHVRRRWPPVRIIVISGLVDTQLSQLPDDCLFLAKPYRPEGLAEALLHTMGGGGPRATGTAADTRLAS
jgi:CheY-like chemotaxis protein